MPKGKRGPYPQMKVEPETVTEDQNDPTAEDIVGAENVVNVTNYEESAKAIDEAGMRQYREEFPDNFPAGYKCANCIFNSNLLSEMEEHVSGTGHGTINTHAPDVPPVQPELFRPPGVISRSIQIPLDPELLAEKRECLSALYQKALDVKFNKKTVDAGFNATLTDIDEHMQEIARILRSPYTYETKDCEWRIIEGENARALYRLDTGEEIERSPLTQEDFQAEHEHAEAANAEPEAEDPEAASLEAIS